MRIHDYESIDALGKLFVEALFAEFPNWEPLARVVKDQKTCARWVEIDIKQEGTDRALHLSTSDAEITIGFDRWHTHIGTFLGIDIEESVATAMSIIRDFMAETRIVYVVYREGKWLHSGLRYREAPANPPEPNSSIKEMSWRRSYDRDIETP